MFSRFSTPLFLAAMVAFAAISPATVRAENEGQEDLDKATELQLTARSLKDLETVGKLCESAIKKGLDKDNEQFARQLFASTMYEHSSRIARAFLDAERPNPRWQFLRHVATNNLEKAIQFKDDLAEAHILLARMHLLPNGDRKRALKAADRAVELYGEDKEKQSESLVIRARLQEDEAKQIADFDQAVKTDPNNAKAWEQRARYYLAKGDYEKAVEGFEQLLEKNEKNVVVRLAMAEALANLEKYEEAIKQASLAIETAPKMTQAYTLRARIFAMEDKVDEALNDLNSAIDLDPGDLQALLVRAELHLLKEKYDAARKDVESAMRARPGLAMAVLLRSRISSAEGHDAKEKKKKTLSRIKFAAAMQDIRLLISHDPENVEWQMQLAFLHSADGQPRKAISVLNQAVKKHDDSARAYRSRADAYLSVGKHAEAIKDYEKSIELDPKFEGALNNLAWVLATSPKDEVRDGKRALELAKKACEVTEYKASYILSTLASAHAELGDFEEAIKWSKKAVELSEDHLKEQLGDELKSYEEGKPWRELQETEENPDFKAPAGDVVET